MGLDPQEKGWFARHAAATTILVIIIIAVAGTGLKILQQKYFPAPEEQEFKTPIFLNETFEQVDMNFNVNSNLTLDEQDELFDRMYRYNVVNWTCRPIGCSKILGKQTLKLICNERGFTEDVRVAMNEDCTESAKQMEVTVVFQLLSKTSGEYYIGRSGTVVG